MRAALYLRVSTRDKGQDAENQRRQLRQFCESQGWGIVAEFEDHDSGGKSDRPEFQRMRQCAARRQFDVLVFWALDRLTREGTLATLQYLQTLEGYGVHWRSLTEAWIDSAGPFRDTIISLLASLAKQERVRLIERVQAGMARARETGTRSGRPIGRPRIIFPRDQVAHLRKEGLSWNQIARRLGASPTAVRRVHAEAASVSNACQKAETR
jgi:DNA invertase Pin-like site-specific DNA recombinase